MDNWWTIWQLAKMKNEQLLKEAEMERLVRMVQPKPKRSFNGFHFLLNKLEKILIRWGSFLQKRYNETTHI
jgi:hypothetical protein